MIDETIKNLLWLGYGKGGTPEMAFDIARSQRLTTQLDVVLIQFSDEIRLIEKSYEKVFELQTMNKKTLSIALEDFIKAYLTGECLEINHLNFYPICGYSSQYMFMLCSRLKKVLEKQLKYCCLKMQWGCYQEHYIRIENAHKG